MKPPNTVWLILPASAVVCHSLSLPLHLIPRLTPTPRQDRWWSPEVRQWPPSPTVVQSVVSPMLESADPKSNKVRVHTPHDTSPFMKTQQRRFYPNQSFSNKNELPQVGFESLLCVLDRDALTNWATETAHLTTHTKQQDLCMFRCRCPWMPMFVYCCMCLFWKYLSVCVSTTESRHLTISTHLTNQDTFQGCQRFTIHSN